MNYFVKKKSPSRNKVNEFSLDFSRVKEWVYPSQYEIRTYQQKISEECLKKNTMVVLPTGLGKTLIAAVVIYNYYRWYEYVLPLTSYFFRFPKGKIIFLAPTKPLVNQQCKACRRDVNLPDSVTMEITGEVNKKKREVAWKKKRIFFSTPQCVDNDLKSGTCPGEKIILLVFDEAHKAQGKYSYCKIIEQIVKKSRAFRVVGLTATPGRDIPTIQKVVRNLLIENIEVRSEEDGDVKPYTFDKKISPKIVTLNREINSVRANFERWFLEESLSVLYQNGVIRSKKATDFWRNKIIAIKESKPFIRNSSERSKVDMELAKLMSLYLGYEMINNQGLGCFLDYFTKIEREVNSSYTQRAIKKNVKFPGFIKEVRKLVKSGIKHPKLVEMEKIIMHHFEVYKNLRKDNDDTKVIIFAQYRGTVESIVKELAKNKAIRCCKLIGQGNSGKRSSGLKQKEQQDIINRFRRGVYNVLVSTSVGEEGLDIGQTDLIICYDGLTSPIRMIQRMGRTGRKRRGNIFILLTKGYEEVRYFKNVEYRNKILQILKRNKYSLKYNPKSSLRLPGNPKCVLKAFEKRDDRSPFTPRKKRGKSQTISLYRSEYLQNRFGSLDLKPNPNFFRNLFRNSSKNEKWLSLQESSTPYYEIPHNSICKMFTKRMRDLMKDDYVDELGLTNDYDEYIGNEYMEVNQFEQPAPEERNENLVRFTDYENPVPILKTQSVYYGDKLIEDIPFDLDKFSVPYDPIPESFFRKLKILGYDNEIFNKEMKVVAKRSIDFQKEEEVEEEIVEEKEDNYDDLLDIDIFSDMSSHVHIPIDTGEGGRSVEIDDEYILNENFEVNSKYETPKKSIIKSSFSDDVHIPIDTGEGGRSVEIDDEYILNEKDPPSDDILVFSSDSDEGEQKKEDMKKDVINTPVIGGPVRKSPFNISKGPFFKKSLTSMGRRRKRKRKKVKGFVGNRDSHHSFDSEDEFEGKEKKRRNFKKD